MHVGDSPPAGVSEARPEHHERRVLPRTGTTTTACSSGVCSGEISRVWVSEGGLEPGNPRVFPGSALEYAGGEKSPVRGFHAAMVAGALRLLSSISSAAGSSSRAARPAATMGDLPEVDGPSRRVGAQGCRSGRWPSTCPPFGSEVAGLRVSLPHRPLAMFPQKARRQSSVGEQVTRCLATCGPGPPRQPGERSRLMQLLTSAGVTHF